MKIKQKLAAKALFVGALFAVLMPLLSAYVALHSTPVSAAGTNTATIVPNQYSPIDNQQQKDNSGYQCTAAIHKPTNLGDSNGADTNLSGGPGALAITAVQTGYGPGTTNQFKVISHMLSNVQGTNGSYQPTFNDVGLNSQNVLYIDFHGFNNNADNENHCQTALWLFRQPGNSNSTQFFGFWNTGKFLNPSDLQSDLSKNLAAVTATVDVTNKTVAFQIPGGYPNSGSYTMNLSDPDSVLGNTFFPPASGGGSTTAGGNCLETVSKNGGSNNDPQVYLDACIKSIPNVASFSNAATILYNGDLYTASAWGGDTMVYNLTTAADGVNRTVGGRSQIIMHTDNANFDINMDTKGSYDELKQIATALTNSQKGGQLYDIELDNVSKSGMHTTGNIKINPFSLNNWAVYYQQDDAVSLVFGQAAANEQPYFGTYTRVKGTNNFALAGSNWGGKCQGLATFSFTGGDPAKAPVIHEDGVQVIEPMSAIWAPLADDGKCDPGNIPVMVDINATDHVPNNNPALNSTSGNGPEIDCHVSLFNPLSWFLCPLATALETVVSGLDDEINNFMEIPQGQGSYDTSNKACTPADQWCYYYAPWSVMRDLALAFSVIFALVAIVSQAFGFEIFDAYTIRKVLPRLIIAIIGTTLSWPLMMFFINLINGIGLDIRGLIYTPFNNTGFNKIALEGGGQFVSSLFAAGAIGALGFAGLLSFVATAALAVALAFLVLTLRQMVITMLVIFAPIAIVCSILPNTQKAWKLWWDSFSRGLLMFPIIASFIALGRVFAAVNSKNAGSVNQIIAFTAYFAPYFLIPFAFRLAGGAIATLGGLVNDRGRGAFDRLKKYRGAKTTQNLHDMATGNRAKGDSAFANAFNATTRNAANLQNAGFVPWKMRSRMQGAAAAHGLSELGEYMEKNSAFAAIKGNDDYLQATMRNMGGGDSEDDWRTYLSRAGYQGRALEQGVAAIRNAKRSTSNEIFQRAAVVANAATGTGWKKGGAADMYESINEVTHGDTQTSNAMLAQMRSMAGQAGRLDLSGPGFGTSATAMENLRTGRINKADANSMVTENAIYTKSAGEYARARGQAIENMAPHMVKRLEKAHTRVARARSGGNEQAIEAAERNLGQEYAALDNLHDSLNHNAPENARIIADTVLNAKIRVDGAETTVQSNMEEFRSGEGASGTAYLQTRKSYDRAQAEADSNRPPDPNAGG
ncbi:MAG TPA: hypothetical protein VLG92_00815 [Candidatus Saccharimonadia bacterium]|nr:hypothetical protein [Candidatus Saccharimonadia bacterium]